MTIESPKFEKKTESEKEARIKDVEKQVNEIMAHHTKKSLSQIEKDTDRDYFLSASEAVEYGVVDKIIK